MRLLLLLLLGLALTSCGPDRGADRGLDRGPDQGPDQGPGGPGGPEGEFGPGRPDGGSGPGGPDGPDGELGPGRPDGDPGPGGGDDPGGPSVPAGRPGDGPDDGRRSSAALIPASTSDRDRSELREAGPELAVRISLEVTPESGTGQFVFVGVPPGDIEEGWIRTGQRPAFFWVSPLVSLAPPIRLRAPLPIGLHYFAVLNLDGDDLPGPEDRVSSPVALEAELGRGQELGFAVGPRLRDILPHTTAEEGDEDEPLPGDEGGELRTLVIANEVRLPFIRTGRFLVVGLPPSPEDEFGYPPDAAPSFLWTSEATRLKWPVTLEGKVPDAVDLLVVLDLDASGAPDVGDLTTKPIFAFRRPPAGESVTVTLQTVVPVPGGESNEERPDHEEVEGPAEPGDEEEEPPTLPPGAILVAPPPAASPAPTP